ncbi:MAG: hypothetical protein AMDU1_APLC00020G0038 [Thermoplasmatales archaeon A-plasma]|nr:MAG: hypothetical protein AMDU1_APLC00020G0038 [Thermoplasmatales archaeon A-plasma]
MVSSSYPGHKGKGRGGNSVRKNFNFTFTNDHFGIAWGNSNHNSIRLRKLIFLILIQREHIKIPEMMNHQGFRILPINR